MAYITCSNCGAKALAVASRCPRCQHPFPTREEQRASMPVTKPPAKAPWFIAGLVVLVAVGGWVAWSASKKTEADRKAAAARIVPVEVAPAPDTSVLNATVADSGGVKTATAPVATTQPAPQPSAQPVAQTPAAKTTPVPPPSSAAPAPQVAPPKSAVADSGAWQRAVVTVAVNVREKPDRASKALLVLVPDDVVMLGESITGWRRVKVDGIDGWVDPRHFEIRPKKK